MTIETIFLGLLFGASLLYLMSPFFSKILEGEGQINFQRKNLNLKKDSLLSDLKDLELDHALKKIDKADYDEIYGQTFADGLSVLKEIENPSLTNDWKGRVEADLVRLKEREI